MGTPIRRFLLRLALEEAIRREEESYSFYQRALDTVQEPVALDLLRTLCAAELRHRLKLEELQRRKDTGIPLELSSPEEAVLLEPRTAQKFPTGRLLSPADVWGVALAKEQQSHADYSLLAEKTTVEAFRDVFRFLSAEEDQHVKWVRARAGA
jgi:rubrerythrin